MAARNIYVFENGKKIRNTAAETIDFLSIKIGATAMEIKETSGKFDFSAKELSNIANASADTSAPGWGQVKTYVAQQVVAGGTVKQNLLSEIQLDDSLGILPGLVTFLTTNAVEDDTIVLKDAAGNTETFTFKNTPSVAFEVAVGGTAAVSMSNLATAINTDSAYWKAYYDTTVLASLYASGLVGIYRKVVTNGATKIWKTGTVAGQVTNYYGLNEYTTSSTVLTALGTSEPTNAQSGFSIAKASLVNGEIHNVIAEDKLKYWNGDYNSGAGAWFTMSEGVIPVATSGSGGAILGKATFDSDKGVEVTGIGIVKAKIDNSSTYFDGSGNIAIKANGVTAAKLNSDVAGAALVLNGVTNAIDVNVDNSSIEVNADAIRVKALGIATGMLAANSVTAAKLNSDTAGAALVLNGVTNALDVNVDNSSIEINTDALRVKALGIATGMLAANSVTAAKLNSDTAGAGLVLNGVSNALDVNAGNGIELAGVGSDFVTVKRDTTGGANLAKAIDVNANGVAVRVDDSSIEGNATTGQLNVKALGIATGMLAANSVTAAKLNSDTAGAGLVLNGVSNALDVNVGDGLELGGVGSDFVKVKSDATGGANLAKVVNVAANGLSIKIDDLSIKENASNQLYIPGTYASLTNDNAGSITVGQIVYVKSNGHVDLAKADALATCSGKLGIVMDATIATTAAGNIWLMEGLPVALFSSLTLSTAYYLSAATAGAITTTAPSGTVGFCVVPLGKSSYVNTTLCFNPEEVVEILSV